jgi:hypothetical protein
MISTLDQYDNVRFKENLADNPLVKFCQKNLGATDKFDGTKYVECD